MPPPPQRISVSPQPASQGGTVTIEYNTTTLPTVTYPVKLTVTWDPNGPTTTHEFTGPPISFTETVPKPCDGGDVADETGQSEDRAITVQQ